MAESVYKVIELIGTNKESWERPRRPRSAGLANPSAIFASPRSLNSTAAGRRGQSRSLQCQAKGLVQVRGLTLIALFRSSAGYFRFPCERTSSRFAMLQSKHGSCGEPTLSRSFAAATGGDNDGNRRVNGLFFRPILKSTGKEVAGYPI